MEYLEKRKETELKLATGLEKVQNAMRLKQPKDSDFPVHWFSLQKGLLQNHDKLRADMFSFHRELKEIGENQYQEFLKSLKSKSADTSDFEAFHARNNRTVSEQTLKSIEEFDAHLISQLEKIDKRIDSEVNLQLQLLERFSN